MVIYTFIYNNNRVDKVKHELSIEQAKTAFMLSQRDKNTVPYDSTVVVQDTVFYYKNATYVGKSVIVTK